MYNKNNNSYMSEGDNKPASSGNNGNLGLDTYGYANSRKDMNFLGKFFVSRTAINVVSKIEGEGISQGAALLQYIKDYGFIVIALLAGTFFIPGGGIFSIASKMINLVNSLFGR